MLIVLLPMLVDALCKAWIRAACLLGW